MLYYLLIGVFVVFGLQFFLIFQEEGNITQSLKDMWGMMVLDGEEDDGFLVIYWLTTVGAIIVWPFTLCYYGQLELRKRKK